MSGRSGGEWHPPLEPRRGEVEVVIPSRCRGQVRMPEVCSVCGASPFALGEGGEREEPASFGILPVVVDETAIGCFGDHEARAELGFPICETCRRTRGEEAAMAIRVLGVRGHFDGFAIYLAFTNEDFARAFADAIPD